MIKTFGTKKKPQNILCVHETNTTAKQTYSTLQHERDSGGRNTGHTDCSVFSCLTIRTRVCWIWMWSCDICMQQVANGDIIQSVEKTFALLACSARAAQLTQVFFQGISTKHKIRTQFSCLGVADCLYLIFVPRHDIFSPTGVTGPQSSAQKRGQQLWGPAADVIWPHLGGEGNLQWGSGRDARHSIRVSPGNTDSGWTAPNGSYNWKCKSRIVYACKVSFDLYSLRLQFCMCSKSIVLLQNQQQELIFPLPHLWFL